MGVHLGEGSNLGKADTLSVTQGDDLIKGMDEVKGIVQNVLLIQTGAILWDLQRNKMDEEEGGESNN